MWRTISDKVLPGRVTTHVVRLKLFRLKAEGVQKERLPQFGGETADFCIKHGLKVCGIPAFPNSLQSLAYPPEWLPGG